MCELGATDVTALILAGGLGTRLRESVSDRPKVLADVGGRPWLAYLLDQVERAGLREVVLCTGYQGGKVEAAFGAAYGRLELRYSRETEPMGTGGALRLALPLAGTERILAMNGDSYLSGDLAACLARQAREGHEAALVLTEVADTARYGRVERDAQDRITAFLEKGGPAGPGVINAGIYLLTRRAVSRIPVGRAVSIEREVFPGWIPAGLFGYMVPGRFLDMGTPEDYRRAEAFLNPGL